VVDSTDEARMEESAEELNNLLAEEKLAGVPLLIYANKQDLDLAEPEDVVSKQLDCFFPSQYYSYFQLTEKLQLTCIIDRHWRLQPCSALKNEGIKVRMSKPILPTSC